MQTIYVIKGGITYQLGRGTWTWLEDEDICGMADVERYASRGAQQDGDTDEGFTLLPRFMNLVFGVTGTSPSALWTKINHLVRVFKPEADPITLNFSTLDGQARRIDCHFAGGLKLPTVDRQGGFYQRVGVVLKANNPVFYNPTLNVLTFEREDQGTPVPTPVPTPVGSSIFVVQRTITYQGTWYSNPWIRFVGPITDAEIENFTTGERIGFTGVTLGAGEYYEVDTRYDYKTVVDQDGVRQATDDDSDLATFHLAAAEDGGEQLDNVLRVSGTGATAATRVYLSYYTWFETA